MNDASGEHVDDHAGEVEKSEAPLPKNMFSNDDAHLSPR